MELNEDFVAVTADDEDEVQDNNPKLLPQVTVFDKNSSNISKSGFSKNREKKHNIKRTQKKFDPEKVDPKLVKKYSRGEVKDEKEFEVVSIRRLIN
jgi:uncharacterized protein YdhG (YjbR/CyaY superfamily)